MHTVQPIKLSDLMLSNALSYSPQLYHAANPHCLALQKVVKVSATGEGHQYSENFMGCTVLHCKQTSKDATSSLSETSLSCIMHLGLPHFPLFILDCLRVRTGKLQVFRPFSLGLIWVNQFSAMSLLGNNFWFSLIIRPIDGCGHSQTQTFQKSFKPILWTLFCIRT